MRSLALLLAAALLLPLAGCTSPDQAETHLRIDFAGARTTVDTHVSFDAAARPADSYYAAHGRPHTSYTAFDQLVAWSYASATELTIDNFSFGPCLSKIDDVPAKAGCQEGATSYWSLSINGTPSEVGMDAAALKAGDKVEWVLTPL